MKTLTLLAAAAVILGGGASVASAQPQPMPGPAAAAPPPGAAMPPPQGARPPQTPAVRAAHRTMMSVCATDLARLCPDARPGPGAPIAQCIRQHRADLSPPCRSAVVAMRQARQAGQ